MFKQYISRCLECSAYLEPDDLLGADCPHCGEPLRESNWEDYQDWREKQSRQRLREIQRSKQYQVITSAPESGLLDEFDLLLAGVDDEFEF